MAGMRAGEKLLLIGPNRHSDCPVIEWQLIPDEAELAALQRGIGAPLEWLSPLLPALDAAGLCFDPADDGGTGRRLSAAGALFAAVAIALQRAAGHRVEHWGRRADGDGESVWAWFEYEHDGVGNRAAEQALQLVSETLAKGRPAGVRRSPQHSFVGEIGRFVSEARGDVLPADTEAIVRAAVRHDIPCVKLERDPYPGLEGAFRVRRNGLLLLGHARHRQIVDGTFCVSRCSDLHPLIRDREARRSLLASRGLRLIQEHAIPTSDASAVHGMHCLLIAGGTPLVLLHQGRELSVEGLHQRTLELACSLCRALDIGLAALHFVTGDIGEPLEAPGGALVDLDLAPELDRLLAPGSAYFDLAADSFVRWLFPDRGAARIPIVAITGTNGKTTTCRMVSRILQQAGFHTGMVCSEGIYLDGRFETTRVDVGHGAHHFLLERPEVEAAVFEEYFGRIARLGFAYHWCDVAVCTNVTNDHLGRLGTHSLQQMAELKRAVIARARKCAVLNADDPLCLAMARDCEAARVCLVSTRSTAESGLATGPQPAFCVVEAVGDVDWMVLYDVGTRIALLPIADIPATFGGTAEFNVSNAMHAACAAYFAGAHPDDITAALGSFGMSFETTPGRLNRFDGLPFGVIMDYAHNRGGFRELGAFIDRQTVAGRKIVMVGYTGDRKDDDIRAAVAELSGHFDHFVCRNFRIIRQRGVQKIPELLARTLVAAGVDPECIDIVPDAREAMDHALAIACEGDLVVLLVGESEFEDTWQLLRRMSAKQGFVMPA